MGFKFGTGTAWTWSLVRQHDKFKVTVSFHVLAGDESAALDDDTISNTAPCQSKCSAIASVTLSVCFLGLTRAPVLPGANTLVSM